MDEEKDRRRGRSEKAENNDGGVEGTQDGVDGLFYGGAVFSRDAEKVRRFESSVGIGHAVCYD